jgi:hypothetical protein
MKISVYELNFLDITVPRDVFPSLTMPYTGLQGRRAGLNVLNNLEPMILIYHLAKC